MFKWFRSFFTTQPKYKIGDRFEPKYPGKYIYPIKLVNVGEVYEYEQLGGISGGGRISEMLLDQNYIKI